MQKLFSILAVFLTLHTARAADPFVYRAGDGPTFTVTETGLSSVAIGGKNVVSGKWMLEDAGFLLGKGDNWKPLEFPGKSIRKVDDASVVVTHASPEFIVTYTYRFSAEDVAISARVENNSKSPLHASAFTGVVAAFDVEPRGMMPSPDPFWLRSQGLNSGFHPSIENRVGGTYGFDGAFGVGTSPVQIGEFRTGTFWYRDGYFPNARRIVYVVPELVHAGGARTFEFKLRVSSNTDWKHLLEPYKNDFTAAMKQPDGSILRYKPDHRPIGAAVLADPIRITPENPLGFHSDNRRFDRAEGVKEFAKMVAPLKDAGAQGVMIWAIGGWDSRAAMYRADFDVFPPSVQQNLPLLKEEFDKLGLRLGAFARPGESPVRNNWEKDWNIRLNPDDAWHVNMTIERFQRLQKQGFSMFYLDTFGNTLPDVRLMRAYREALGPDVQTFVEHPCDLILPYSGIYLEQVFDEQNKTYKLFFDTDHFWEIARWLVPGASATVVTRIDVDNPQAGDPYRWLMERQITPYIADWRSTGDGPRVRKLVDEFLGPQSQWKPTH
jgi:hypothetical protein